MNCPIERSIRVHELPTEAMILRQHVTSGNSTAIYSLHGSNLLLYACCHGSGQFRAIEEFQHDALQVVGVHHLHLDAQTRRLAVRRRQHDLVESNHVPRAYMCTDGRAADFVRLHVDKRPSFQHQRRFIRRHYDRCLYFSAIDSGGGKKRHHQKKCSSSHHINLLVCVGLGLVYHKFLSSKPI